MSDRCPKCSMLAHAPDTYCDTVPVAAHRHRWDVKGRAPAGTIRTCEICGERQVKQAAAGGGLTWQSPAWLT